MEKAPQRGLDVVDLHWTGSEVKGFLGEFISDTRLFYINGIILIVSVVLFPELCNNLLSGFLWESHQKLSFTGKGHALNSLHNPGGS